MALMDGTSRMVKNACAGRDSDMEFGLNFDRASYARCGFLDEMAIIDVEAMEVKKLGTEYHRRYWFGRP